MIGEALLLSCRRAPLFSTCNRERGSRVFFCYPCFLLARPRVTSSAQASQPYYITRTVWLTLRFLVHRGAYLWVFDDYCVRVGTVVKEQYIVIMVQVIGF